MIKAVICAATLILVVAAAPSDNAQTGKNALQRPIAEIDLKGVTITNAFTRVLRAGNVPGGIVTLRTCGSDYTFTALPSGETLQDFLNAIVFANPRYTWSSDEGVVNLSPSGAHRTLLDVRIPQLDTRAKTLDELLVQVLALPSIHDAISQLKLSQGNSNIGLRYLPRVGDEQNEEEKDIVLHSNNVTLREVLNSVARMRGSVVWNYDEQQCNGRNEFTIQFLVQ